MREVKYCWKGYLSGSILSYLRNIGISLEEVVPWINSLSVDVDFVVEVGSCGATSVAELAYLLAAAELLSLGDAEYVEMTIRRSVAEAVIDYNDLAHAVSPLGEHDFAVSSSMNRRAALTREIDAVVVNPSA